MLHPLKIPKRQNQWPRRDGPPRPSSNQRTCRPPLSMVCYRVAVPFQLLESITEPDCDRVTPDVLPLLLRSVASSCTWAIPERVSRRVSQVGIGWSRNPLRRRENRPGVTAGTACSRAGDRPAVRRATDRLRDGSTGGQKDNRYKDEYEPDSCLFSAVRACPLRPSAVNVSAEL